MEKNDGKNNKKKQGDGFSTYRQERVSKEEGKKYSYMDPVALTPEEKEAVGHEFGHLRFVRFKSPTSQALIIDAKIDDAFYEDIATTIHDKPEQVEFWKKVIELCEALNAPVLGPVLKNLLDLKRAANDDEDGGVCNCPVCTGSRTSKDPSSN